MPARAQQNNTGTTGQNVTNDLKLKDTKGNQENTIAGDLDKKYKKDAGNPTGQDKDLKNLKGDSYLKYEKTQKDLKNLKGDTYLKYEKTGKDAKSLNGDGKVGYTGPTKPGGDGGKGTFGDGSVKKGITDGTIKFDKNLKENKNLQNNLTDKDLKGTSGAGGKVTTDAPKQ